MSRQLNPSFVFFFPRPPPRRTSFFQTLLKEREELTEINPQFG